MYCDCLILGLNLQEDSTHVLKVLLDVLERNMRYGVKLQD